jgi:hypothetical protein
MGWIVEPKRADIHSGARKGYKLAVVPIGKQSSLLEEIES